MKEKLFLLLGVAVGAALTTYLTNVLNPPKPVVEVVQSADDQRLDALETDIQVLRAFTEGRLNKINHRLDVGRHRMDQIEADIDSLRAEMAYEFQDR